MDFSEKHEDAETLADDLICHAVMVLKDAERAGLKLATAESCTGGLLASRLSRCLDHLTNRSLIKHPSAE